MSGIDFISFVFNKLKDYHPVFRYPLLTGGDYEPYIHQLDIFFRLLPRDPIRFLIADDVGLGKTIEGIMLIDQVIRRGGKNVLLIAPRTLVMQWYNELSKFNGEWKLPIYNYYESKETTKLDDGIWIVSVDTIKRNEHFKKFISKKWDIILVDEIHKIGIIGNKENKRYTSLKQLVERNIDTSFVGLSATPHKGDEDDYFKRMLLIDPHLKEELVQNLPLVLIFKRNKNLVNEVYEGAEIFPKALFIQVFSDVTEVEKEYYDLIVRLSLDIIKKYYNMKREEPKALQLLAFIIGRRAMSSPMAGLMTFKRIVENRSPEIIAESEEEELEDYAEEEETDVELDETMNKFVERNAALLSEYKEYVMKLIKLSQEVMKNDTRLNRVIDKIKECLDRGDKVIVFTEYKDTANYIYEHVKEKLRLSDNELLVIHSDNLNKIGGIEEVKKWLAKGDRKVLITTDVASEGLNLQEANVLIHYELPLSIVRFEQRNGRVWRLKQKKTVEIYYITLNTKIERNLVDKYYNKLFEIAKATISEITLPSRIEYVKEEKAKVVDLSSMSPDTQLNVGYVNPEKKVKDISPMKINEALILDEIDSVVNEIIQRIKRSLEYSKRVSAVSTRTISNDLNRVRLLAGFENRKDIKESLEAFLETLIKKQNGEIKDNKGKKEVRVATFIDEYDATRIGELINVTKNVIGRLSRVGTFGNKDKFYIVTDGLDYTLFFALAKVKLKQKDAFTIPIFIKHDGEIVRLNEVFRDVFPKLLEGNVKEVEVITENLSPHKAKDQIKTEIFALIQRYVSYKQSVRNDKWLPNSREDIEVSIEPIGGIFGVKGNSGMPKPEEIAAKIGGTIEGGKIKYMNRGKYELLAVVSPHELLQKKGVISVINGNVVKG